MVTSFRPLKKDRLVIGDRDPAEQLAVIAVSPNFILLIERNILGI